MRRQGLGSAGEVLTLGSGTWYELQSSLQSPGISGSASVPLSLVRFPGPPWTDSLDMASTSREVLGCAGLPISCSC